MWQNRDFPEAFDVLLSLRKTDGPSARFCPACGAASPAVSARAPFPGQLTRPRYPRMIAGVCAGLALHYGWDLSLVRVVAVLALFVSGGTAMLAYFAAWIIIPEAPYALPEQQHRRQRWRQRLSARTGKTAGERERRSLAAVPLSRSARSAAMELRWTRWRSSMARRCMFIPRSRFGTGSGCSSRPLRDAAATVCYAVKANSSLAILRMLAELGAGFDIVSGGELERVRRANKTGAEAGGLLRRGQAGLGDRRGAEGRESCCSTWSRRRSWRCWPRGRRCWACARGLRCG